MRFFAAQAAQQQKKPKQAKSKSPKNAAKGQSQASSTDAIVEDQGPKVVNIYREKRNAFYKLGFNENHIPNQGNYEKDKK